MVGPYGPLWAYDVITFVKEPTCTRVNWLLMPHARITAKRSGCVPSETVSSLLGSLTKLATDSSPKPGETPCIVVRHAAERRFAPFDCYSGTNGEELERLGTALNKVQSLLELTYSSYPPVEDEKP